MQVKHGTIALLCAITGASLPAATLAQTSQAYASVRGWNISGEYENGQFVGCHAAANTRADTFALRTRSYGMELVVPNEGPRSGFDGAVVTVDRTRIDAQFGFEGDYATRAINAHEVGLLRSGANLSVHINGQYKQSYSLRGSSAAILKLQECDQRGGQIAAAATTPPPPSNNATVQAWCSAYTGESYGCKLVQHSPEPGYAEAFEVISTGGYAPKYFFKVISDVEADTWVAFNDGDWMYMGKWQPSPDGCSEPHPQQGAEARSNLGQDAWGLCVN